MWERNTRYRSCVDEDANVWVVKFVCGDLLLLLLVPSLSWVSDVSSSLLGTKSGSPRGASAQVGTYSTKEARKYGNSPLSDES